MPPDFEHDPEAAVAALIGRLPDIWGELTHEDHQALGVAFGGLGELMITAATRIETIVDGLRDRGLSSGATTGDVATEAEMAELDGLYRRLLTLERAQAAIDAWEVRAGVPCAAGPREPLVSEEPDGSIVVRTPAVG
jgi:hypothetical protein